mgnify:CR=1 FL=1
MDVDEFLNNLFHQLEGDLKKIGTNQKLIENLFGGTLCNEV